MRFLTCDIFVTFFVLLTTYQSEAASEPKIKWVSSETANRALLIPTGELNGAPCYLARTTHLSSKGYIPGCVAEAGKELQYVMGFQGVIHSKKNFQFLVYPRNSLKWVVTTSHWDLPENAFSAGTSHQEGGHLHICRGYNDRNELLVGWISKKTRECIIPHSGPSFPFSIYQVLVHTTL